VSVSRIQHPKIMHFPVQPSLFQLLTGAVLCLSTTAVPVSSQDPSPLVSLDYITLKGRTTPSSISTFFNIPYASPPTGPLRFHPPQPPLKYEGVRDATNYGAACMQDPQYFNIPSLVIDEDCLNLNVYAPVSFHGNNTSKEGLPVAVYL
jgi:hypothetical protein